MKLFFFLMLLMLASCSSKNKSKQNYEQNDTLQTNSYEANFPKQEIIFSTLNLEASKILTLEEIRKVMKIKEGGNSEYDDGYIRLPQFNCFDIVVYYVKSDFSDVYTLFIYKDGDPYDSLNISPYFKDPDTSSLYSIIKYFEIYKGYKIKLITETTDAENVAKTTKYFRINKIGKFIEVKE